MLGISFQTFCAFISGPYYYTAYRIRGWGRLPRRGGPLLVIANHQHDLDVNAAAIRICIQGPWNATMYSASSRRVFEPGFMGIRIPWLEKFLGRLNAASLFGALGMLPIENELFARSISAIAYFFSSRHGDLPLASVFRADVIEKFGPRAAGQKLSWLFGRSAFTLARKMRVGMNAINEPYRSQIISETRAIVVSDLQRIEDKLRSGVTFYLTPEGRYSTDGSVGRFRQALRRLRPLADVYMIAMSYDVFVGGRLSVLFRILPPADPNDLRASLQAARPVTTSQLLAWWMLQINRAFSEREAVAAVNELLAALPPDAFLDPDLARRPSHMVRSALRWMVRRRILQAENDRYRLRDKRIHPQFAQVKDIVAFQATFFNETRAALHALKAARTPDAIKPVGTIGRDSATPPRT